MFVEHGGAGFWVRRTTWGGTCARVVRVGEITAPEPYFGSPSVLMDVYSLDGTMRDSLAPLPAAGTYKTWRKIDPPPWAARLGLRPLDDPSIGPALAALDRKRGKGKKSARETGGGGRIQLNVPYARKDEAKRIGARWSPADESWWISADDTHAVSDAKALGFISGDD